jgi:protein-disulfide isomerase
MGMRRIAAALAVLSVVLATGCTSVVSGRAVARASSTSTGIPLSDDGYGIVLGTLQDGGAAAIDLFIEPQCPHCGHFVIEYGDAIGEHVVDGQLSVTVRPLTFLDNGSDDYSARATNAIFLVAADDEAGPALVWKFIQELYARLVSSASLADDDGIAQIANDVGVSADTVNRIAAAEAEVDATEINDGNTGVIDEYGLPAATPTVYDTLGETDVDITDPQWLDELVK